jgi:hypothetical protein
MSAESLQRLISDVQALPEVEQNVLLSVLEALKERHQRDLRPKMRFSNPALAEKEGLLVFTGAIEAPETDWVRQDREEPALK